MKKMVFALILMTLVSSSCKKAVDNIKEDLMVNLITSNTWVVVRYMEGAQNITPTFSTYEFKFYKSGNVDAIENGITKASGTWQGSEATQSITSNFPTTGDPINKLNGVWKVTNTKSNPWRVFSQRNEGATQLNLDLQAK